MVRVKICGICRLEDAQLACELGADAVGFVFWPGSPRFIDPYRARAIAATLPPFATPVGVFVDQPPSYVAGVATLLGLGAAQLHGREDVGSYVAGGCRIIKSVGVAADLEVATALADLPEQVTPLLDVHDPVRHGGTGRTIDWSVAAAAARSRRVILSGGLRPENVAEAIATVRPYAIDVSSGVESAPGAKDHQKLRDFFAAVHRTLQHPVEPFRTLSNPLEP